MTVMTITKGTTNRLVTGRYGNAAIGMQHHDVVGSQNPATQISVTTQPSGATNGSPFSIQPVIQLKDTGSINVAESGITITAYIISGSGTLNGSKTINTDSTGKATFTNLSIAGTGAHTIGFHAIMSTVHQIWSDDVEINRTTLYFETGSAGGRFGRALDPQNNNMAWKSTYQSGIQTDHGNLKLSFGRTPGGQGTPVYSNQLDFADVTVEFDLRHTIANPYTDKLVRFIVFSHADWSEAAIAHLWSNNPTMTRLALDPASGVNSSGVVVTTGYNDFANLSFLGLMAGTDDLVLGSTAATRKRIKFRMKLDDPGQANGLTEYGVDGVIDASTSSLAFVKTYTSYGINSVFIENYTNSAFAQTYDRYFDNINVYGQARAIIASNSLTVI